MRIFIRYIVLIVIFSSSLFSQDCLDNYFKITDRISKALKDGKMITMELKYTSKLKNGTSLNNILIYKYTKSRIHILTGEIDTFTEKEKSITVNHKNKTVYAVQNKSSFTLDKVILNPDSLKKHIKKYNCSNEKGINELEIVLDTDVKYQISFTDKMVINLSVKGLKNMPVNSYNLRTISQAIGVPDYEFSMPLTFLIDKNGKYSNYKIFKN